MTDSNKKIIIITAPSGAGKTSVTKYLLQKNPQLAFSVSAATRQPRAFEQNGKDYYFISLREFHQKIKENAFVEWEMVYEGKYYGTLKGELERIWEEDKIPVLDIDVHGAIHVQEQFPAISLSVFIEPPSVEELKIRLEKRGTENAEGIETRLKKAAYELSFKQQFNHIIVNDDLQKTFSEANKIVADFILA